MKREVTGRNTVLQSLNCQPSHEALPRIGISFFVCLFVFSSFLLQENKYEHVVKHRFPRNLGKFFIIS